MARSRTCTLIRAGGGPAPDPALHAFARAVADRVEQRSVASLVPFAPRRARTHTPEQVEAIKGSLLAFGFINPLIVDEDARVLAGHARLEAARQLGWASVPVVVASHLTADEKRAYVLADNRLAEKAGWDAGVLAIELEHLSSLDLGFEMDAIGFTVAEIDLAIGEAAGQGSGTGEEQQDPADAEPPTGPAVTRPGDLWLLGRHRLLCGDALDPRSYGRLLGGEKARMIISDPPFNLKIGGVVSGLGRVKHREFAMASGEMSEGEFTAFLISAMRRMAGSLVDGGLLYLFMDWRHQHELLTAARALGLAQLNLCVWNKGTGGMGSHYRSQHELCSVFKAGTAPHLNTVELGRHGRYRTNVWTHPGFASFGRGRDAALADHPTVKPVALLAEAIKDASRRGDLVIDPFLGSGSTLLAAERTGRRCAGTELDASYCDTIVRRFEALTGEEAVHADSGMTFAEVAEARAGEAELAEEAAAEPPDQEQDADPSTWNGEGQVGPAAPRVRHRERSRAGAAGTGAADSTFAAAGPVNRGATARTVVRQRAGTRAREATDAR